MVGINQSSDLQYEQHLSVPNEGLNFRRYDDLFDLCEDLGYLQHPIVSKSDDEGTVQSKIVCSLQSTR